MYGQNILEDLLQQITNDKAGKTYVFVRADTGGVKIEGTVIIIPKVQVPANYTDTITLTSLDVDSVKVVLPEQPVIIPTYNRFTFIEIPKNEYKFTILEWPSRQYFVKDFEVVDSDKKMVKISLNYEKLKPAYLMPLDTWKDLELNLKWNPAMKGYLDEDKNIYIPIEEGYYKGLIDDAYTPHVKGLVRQVEQALKERGYKLDINNILEKKDIKALKKFQRKHKLPIGHLDFETLKALGLYM